MKFQFFPYIIPLIISFVMLAALAVYGYKHRSVRGGRAFTVSMLIGSFWALTNGLEIAGIDLNTKLFWANLQYIAYSFAPVTWLVMVLQFTARSAWLKKKNIIWMCIIPVITVILVWIDHRYGLVRYNFALETAAGLSVISKEYGPWFWIHCIYSYLLNIAAVFLLFKAILLKNTIYRKQGLYLLIGFIIIAVCNVFYIAGLSPFENFDISPISFSISGLIICWGIFKSNLFDLVPIARETVIEKMGSGILVIDKLKRIIDINPQAREILGISTGVIGQQMKAISAELQQLIPEGELKNSRQIEFSLGNNNQDRKYYELYISSIKNKQKEHIAWVLIINNITDLKLAREQINLQMQELAVMNDRERMARELHDNMGQVLGFANIQIQAVRQELKKENYQLADQYLQRLSGIIRDANKDIREYVYNIRNKFVNNNNIYVLLKDEIEGLKQNSRLEVDFIADKDSLLTNLGIEEKLQLIHIVRESFTNILKYAEADKVQVSLRTDGESGSSSRKGRLTIRDNGKGINSPISGGAGLSIMNERARLISGYLSIDSSKGKGTAITCIFPVQELGG